MRKLLPILLFIGIGCRHCPRCLDCSPQCQEREVARECPKAPADCPPAQGRKPAPAPVCEAPAPRQQAKPQDITIKVPPQKIYLQTQAPQAVQPQGVMPMGQAQGVQPQMMMVPMAEAQSAPAGRARPGLTLDFFRLPIPFPRLVAIPEAAPMMRAVPMMAMPMQQAVMPMQQAVMPMQQAVMPMQQAVMPQAVAPTHMTVPVQSTVPVQGMMQVPVQGHMPVQGHITVPLPGQVGVQGVMPVQAQGAAPARAQAALMPPQMQNVDWDQVERMCQLLQELRAKEQQIRQQQQR